MKRLKENFSALQINLEAGIQSNNESIMHGSNSFRNRMELDLHRCRTEQCSNKRSQFFNLKTLVHTFNT